VLVSAAAGHELVHQGGPAPARPAAAAAAQQAHEVGVAQAGQQRELVRKLGLALQATLVHHLVVFVFGVGVEAGRRATQLQA
jgi:hypothetical protein